MVLIRDRAEPVGTPLLRLPPSPDVPSATTVDLDALGAAAELPYGGFRRALFPRLGAGAIGRACVSRRHALHRSWPAAISNNQDFVVFPSHQSPSLSEIQELAGKGRLHTTDDGIVLLVRQSTTQPPSDSQHPVGRAACLSNDDHVRVNVPLLMRRWVMQACHSTASCHLGTTRTCLLYTSPSPRD